MSKSRLIGRASRLNTPLWRLIGTATASSSATVDFTWAGKTYKKVVVVVNAALPATNDVEAWVRTSTDGGSTYDAGASDYEWIARIHNMGGVDESSQATSVSEIAMASQNASDAVGSGANEGWWGTIEIIMPAQTTHTVVLFCGAYEDPGGQLHNVNGSGRRLSAANVDGVRFMFQSGNIASGEFAAYGLL